MTLGRTLAIARKEVLQLKRDRRSLILAFVLPLILVLVFGAAISLDVREIPFAVVDQDRSAESRELVDGFGASGYFTLRGYLETTREADPLLARGAVRLILVIPPDFRENLAAKMAAPVQVLVDGGDANTATIAINYADAIAAGLTRPVTVRTQRAVPIRIQPRIWYNETLDSARMVVPGLVAVIMAIIAAMLTALTIAREWERGTMEQLVSTPVSPFEVVIGKLLPYVAIGAFDVAMVIILGLLVFHVPLRGNVFLLGGLSLLFLVGMLSYGILLSASLKSQLLATMVALVTTYLPTLLLSGFIFSIASMPFALRVISHLIPARYFITITRGIFLKGAGLGMLWPQAVGMALFAVVALLLAARSFRKEIG
ncbi:MAG: ABC transporter permease [Gemmatimonadales bacterium]|nr:MAG: ABC transporter permease [Gemmatimonadales bacterium]